jgi:hypothetical protein
MMWLGALSLDHRELFSVILLSFCAHGVGRWYDSMRLCIRCDPAVFLVFLST